jgi:hypothetical protein
MKKMGLFVIVVVSFTLLHSAQAQKLAIGLSPFAGVVTVANTGAPYSTSYNLFVEFFKSDSSQVRLQVRYDYFTSSNKENTGKNNSFQNLGIGTSVAILKIQNFQAVGCASVGFLMTKSGTSHPNYDFGDIPSSANLTLGCRVEWLATRRFAPFIESSILNSIKLNADEKTKVELFVLRIGIIVR